MTLSLKPVIVQWQAAERVVRLAKIIGICMALFGCSTTVEPEYEIVSTADDKVLETVLQSADKNTLVVFDCDEVLITTTDVTLSPHVKPPEIVPRER